MFRHLWIRSRNQDTKVTMLRTGRPDLLAIDDPVIAIFFGPGTKPSQI